MLSSSFKARKKSTFGERKKDLMRSEQVKGCILTTKKTMVNDNLKEP